MKKILLQRKTLFLVALLSILIVIFAYVTLFSGSMAPVAVVIQPVENKELSPSLFGIGTVKAQYEYKIGPVSSGRVKRLSVNVGEYVKQGQVLGEMDPVDLDDRILAQEAILKQAEARLSEYQAKLDYAALQAKRYERLYPTRAVSEEALITRQYELSIARAEFSVAQKEFARVIAEKKMLDSQRENLVLIAPADGLVVSRDAEPGTTLVAGQAVLKLIDPQTLWINARFDQSSAQGLSEQLSAMITLRSQPQKVLTGKVLRVEPLADAVTEELIAKVIFSEVPKQLPPVGELAEITISLPKTIAHPVVPNAAIRNHSGKVGVWTLTHDKLHFAPVTTGIADLEGNIQILHGVEVGEKVVVYSENNLTEHSRIRLVTHLAGASK